MSDNEKQQEPESLRDKLEKNCKSKCVINQYRTAYLCVDDPVVAFSVYNDLNETVTDFNRFSLRDVSEEIQTKQSPHYGFTNSGSGDAYGFLNNGKKVKRHFYELKEIHEIFPNTLLVLFEGDRAFLATKDSCDDLEDNVFRTLLRSHLQHNSSQRLKGLSKVRSNGEFDFTFVTKEGTIPVHTLVFKACLPFFAAMMDSKMSESSENRLEIPYPHSWVEAMVSYFYGEPFEVDFEQATGLLILADVYDIPELQRLAVSQIKSERLDMSKCLAGWKNAFEAQNEEMRAYFAAFARRQLDKLEQSAEFLHDMSQQEAVELMLDVSRSKKESARVLDEDELQFVFNH